MPSSASAIATKGRPDCESSGRRRPRRARYCCRRSETSRCQSGSGESAGCASIPVTRPGRKKRAWLSLRGRAGTERVPAATRAAGSPSLGTLQKEQDSESSRRSAPHFEQMRITGPFCAAEVPVERKHHTPRPQLSASGIDGARVADEAIGGAIRKRGTHPSTALRAGRSQRKRGRTQRNPKEQKEETLTAETQRAQRKRSPLPSSAEADSGRAGQPFGYAQGQRSSSDRRLPEREARVRLSFLFCVFLSRCRSRPSRYPFADLHCLRRCW